MSRTAVVFRDPELCYPSGGKARTRVAVKRRAFITLIGGAAAWPVVALAQQPGRLRRIGALMSWDESDPEIKTFLSGFRHGLSELGWTDGGNVRLEVRWAGGNVDRLRMFAKELVDLQPDVILATSTPSTAAPETRQKIAE